MAPKHSNSNHPSKGDLPRTWAAQTLAFAAAVGDTRPVTCVGGQTHWSLAGTADSTADRVSAPSGVVDVLPEEMLVRVGAGTPLVELAQALFAVGQQVCLPQDADPLATVGGALAVGHGGRLQLKLGPPRDSVMEVTYITAQGQISKSGGPVVKNVSGFDMCRLLVGSFGTLGFISEVVLRATPIPAVSQWLVGPPQALDPQTPEVDQSATSLQTLLHAPASLLYTPTQTYVLLEGHAMDVKNEATMLGTQGFEPVSQGPTLLPHRISCRRGQEYRAGVDSGVDFVALGGVGVVTSTHPGPKPRIDSVAASLNRRLKQHFDPTGRMNPGRDVLAGTVETDSAARGTLR